MTRKCSEYLRTETQDSIFDLISVISSLYRDLHQWTSNQWPQIADLKTLQLSHHSILQISDAKFTNGCNMEDTFRLIGRAITMTC